MSYWTMEAPNQYWLVNFFSFKFAGADPRPTWLALMESVMSVLLDSPLCPSTSPMDKCDSFMQHANSYYSAIRDQPKPWLCKILVIMKQYDTNESAEWGEGFWMGGQEQKGMLILI